jgi:hypothetical protein
LKLLKTIEKIGIEQVFVLSGFVLCHFSWQDLF